MKAKVIGANSYIARNLIHELKVKMPDCEIKLYDCQDKHIDGNENYQSIQILNRESVSQIDMACDVIFMFVGKTGSAVGFDTYDTFIDINEKVLLNVIDEYRKQRSKAKIVYPSTRLVYKGDNKPLKENSPKEFKTVYAINKYACEKYLEMYSRVYGIKYCIFRICVPYGTLVSGKSTYGTAEFMLSKASEGKNITLYGNGEVRRTITHIKDVCDNLMEGAFSEKCVNGVYNIGGENYSLKEIAGLIADKYGVGIDYVDYPKTAQIIESGSTVFDSSKLRALGITTKHTFKEWIETTNNEKLFRGGVIYLNNIKTALIIPVYEVSLYNKILAFIIELYKPRVSNNFKKAA